MAVIKTRFGNLNLQSTTEAAKVEVTSTTDEKIINPITAQTPLLARINGKPDPEQDNIYKINTTGMTLLDAITVFVDNNTNSTADNGIILNSNNKLVVNINKLQIPLATPDRIGGVKDCDSSLMNFIHVHQTEEANPGCMEINSLSTDKLEQIENHWLILDSVNAAANWDGTETK